MSSLRTIGPASMLVWISSPVRSRKPVLMKMMRSRAARMHSLRLTVVRRSSSMMPILSVFAREAERVLDAREQVARPARLPRGRASSASRCRRCRCASCAGRSCACRSCSAASAVTSRRGCLSGISRAALVEHRVGGHQVADVAHQQQRAAVQRERGAVGRGVVAVGIQRARRACVRPCRSSRRGRPSSGRASCGRPRPCPRRRRRRRSPRSPGSWSARIRAPRP